MYVIVKDHMRTVFLQLSDSLHFLCYFAWRDVSTFALDIEPCMHVKVLANRINLQACLLKSVYKLPMLFHHANLSDPVGNLMSPLKARAFWEALPQVDKPGNHVLLGGSS